MSNSPMTDSTPAVKRWDEAGDLGMQEYGTNKWGRGEYVRFADYEALTRQLAEAQAENAKLAALRKHHRARAKTYKRKHQGAEAALADARRDAERMRAGIEGLETLARESAAWVIAGKLKRLRESGTPAIDAAMSGGTGE